MIDTIRKYLEEEFECAVTVSPVAEVGTPARDGDRCLTFTFHGTPRTVLVAAALLQQVPKDVIAFLTEPGEDDMTFADVVVMADDRPVALSSGGFTIVGDPDSDFSPS